MKVWIIAKTHQGGVACVHGLTEENQNVRLLQPNESYPFAHTKFDVGQTWDLTFSPSSRRIPPHSENVVVKQWKQLGSEPDLRTVLLERVRPWQGGPDQLFDGFLKTVMHTDNAFISERDAFPHKSMGYWLPDAPLIKWDRSQGRFGYRYCTPAKELVIDYTGFTQPISKIPAGTLVHVALHPWWTPSNDLAVDKNSRVEKRCYLYVAGWYL